MISVCAMNWKKLEYNRNVFFLDAFQTRTRQSMRQVSICDAYCIYLGKKPGSSTHETDLKKPERIFLETASGKCIVDQESCPLLLYRDAALLVGRVHYLREQQRGR